MKFFKLLYLPHLALEHVMKLLTIPDILNLIKTSQYAARLISLMRIKINKVFLFWKYSPCVEISRSKDDNFCIEFQWMPKSFMTTLKSRYMLRFDKLIYYTLHCNKDCLEFSDQILSVFKVEQIEHKFLFIGMEYEVLRKCLSDVLSRKHTNVSIITNRIGPKFLNYLMETVDKNSGLEISAFIPNHFQHENAMVFKSLKYSKARWVTLNELKSIRNSDSVFLGETKFTCEDINNFLLYWKNSEFDMMRRLRIQLAKGSVLTRKVLDGMVNIEFDVSGRTVYNIMAKQKPGRKFLLGKVTIDKENNVIELETFLPKELGKEFLLLFQLCERESKLKKKRNELNGEEGLIQSAETLFIPNQKIAGIEIEKKEIDKELCSIQKELNRLEIYDKDGELYWN